MSRLADVNLLDKINMILVSDHGMAQLKEANSTIFIRNFIDLSLLDLNKSFFGEISHVYPNDLKKVYGTPQPNLSCYFCCIVLYLIFLKTQDVFNQLSQIPNLKAYFKGNLPEDYKYNTDNRRIGKIFLNIYLLN